MSSFQTGRLSLKSFFLAMVLVIMGQACSEEKTGKDPIPQGPMPAPESRTDESPSTEKKSDTRVDVYLFHGAVRCYSCNLMEELTQEVLKEKYSKEKQAGAVVFHDINVQEPEQNHFIEDYRISSISIVLSRKTKDKEEQWKNLDKVWMLIRKPEDFKAYVASEILEYLP